MAKKRKPHNPAAPTPPQALHRGQLGLPTPERANHYSDGYEVSQLAVGHDQQGGVVQSRERAILTHPKLLSELYNLLMQDYAKRGEPLPERIEVRQTPADKATAGWRGVLWSYIDVRTKVLQGGLGSVDYEGSSRGSSLSKIPALVNGNKHQFDKVRFYSWVRDQTGFARITDFLDQVILHDNPGLKNDADTILRKWEMGRELYETNNRRDGEHVFYGALVICAQALHEAALDFDQFQRRDRQIYPLAGTRRIA